MRESKILFALILVTIMLCSVNSFSQYALTEDFESGIFPPPDWSNPGNGVLWSSSFFSAYGNGNYCAYYDFYACGNDNDTMISPAFTATGSEDTLIFDHAYAPYEWNGRLFYDYLDIYTSTDGGDTYLKYLHIHCRDLTTAAGTNNSYFPSSNEWGTYNTILPPNVNRIKFVAFNNCANNLFLDNIKVTMQAPLVTDAAVEQAWAKGKLPLFYGVPDTIMTSIKNTGNLTINNLKVYLNVTGAFNLMDSSEITVLEPGNSEVVKFKGMTPVVNGFLNVTVTIPDDNDNGNNVKTAFSQTNATTYSYVDSNCCNSGAGFGGEAAFLTRYRMNNTGQVRKVNAKIYNDPLNVGQIVYGVVVDQNGMFVGRSADYKIQNSDLGNYKTFDITDPKPFVTSNSDFYVGLAQPQVVGPNAFYIPIQMDVIAPARPLANYSSNIVPVGTTVTNLGEFPATYGFNWAIQTVLGTQAAIDAGVASLGLTYDQYFSSTTFTPTGKVFNAGTGSATFTVNRRITPGGYTSTKSVTGLTAGSTANVTFDPWTFTSGTDYTIRDSVVLAGDGNISNNSMTGIITPKIAKQLAVLWQTTNDKDSLVRAILADGRYASDFDTVPVNYTGSYRAWKIIFNTYKDGGNWPTSVRDSLKSYLDNSTAGNRKSLIVFGNRIDFINDPNVSIFGTDPADTIFYRQYLRAFTISTDWQGSIPQSESKFRGTGFFNGITQDSLKDPGFPGLIRPTNGSSAAFKPKSVVNNDNDSCTAVSFGGANYNTFFMSNEFSSIRATNLSSGPLEVYTKIIDWIQSVNANSKVLNLTAEIEGYYDPNTSTMNSDTMRVYLRSSVNPYPKIDSAKAYLSATGQGSFLFSNASNGVGYYIQLKHRNGLETWSKTTQSFSSNSLAYNFTTDSAKSYGNNLKKSGSNWVIFTGDADQNGFVDLTDVINIYNDASAFISGYVKTDVNGNTFTDLTDVILAYNNSTNFVKKSTPLPQPGMTSENEIVFNNSSQTGNPVETLSENKIDHEIYEMYKNMQRKPIITPDDLVYKKGKNGNITKGKTLLK